MLLSQKPIYIHDKLLGEDHPKDFFFSGLESAWS
jgi:hypothetical protein